LRTVWDTRADALVFADAVDRWLAAGMSSADVRLHRAVFDVVFASDAGTASEANAAFSAVPAPVRT
jgi:hypothetical protein